VRGRTGPASSVNRCTGGVLLCTLTLDVSDLGGLLGSVATIVLYLAETGLMVLPWIAAALILGLLGALALIASQRSVAPRPGS
jgi:hypothetical protein